MTDFDFTALEFEAPEDPCFEEQESDPFDGDIDLDDIEIADDYGTED